MTYQNSDFWSFWDTLLFSLLELTQDHSWLCHHFFYLALSRVVNVELSWTRNKFLLPLQDEVSLFWRSWWWPQNYEGVDQSRTHCPEWAQIRINIKNAQGSTCLTSRLNLSQSSNSSSVVRHLNYRDFETHKQGCISCGPCSYPELTEDHVLPSA